MKNQGRYISLICTLSYDLFPDAKEDQNEPKFILALFTTVKLDFILIPNNIRADEHI